MADQPSSRPSARVSHGPRRSVESHEAILDAAEALLSEGGPTALTFEAVARRAKAGKPTLYRWWPNKTALLLEICERQKVGIVDVPDLGSLREELTGLTRSLWTFWRETNAGAAFAGLIAEAQFSPEGREVLAEHYVDEGAGPSLAVFERARSRGELARDADLAVLRKAYVALNWLHLLCGRLDDAAIGPAIDVLLYGMLGARPPVRAS